MNVLQKILEEIRDNAKLGNMHWEAIRIEKVEEIIRSHMDEQEVFKFDFNRVKSFDCQCGRHYVNTYNDSWIPVSKKLPERDYETVLCVDEDDYYFVAVYTKEDGFRTEDFGADYENIIAWQLLPELYRENKQDEKINWDEFKNAEKKIAVHCKTEEEAKDFCRKMHEHGMKWRTKNE